MLRQAMGNRIHRPQPIDITQLQEGSTKPDVVLSLNVTRENAEARYLARARDGNDSVVKFGRRFAEYLEYGRAVEQYYWEAGLLIYVSCISCLCACEWNAWNY